MDKILEYTLREEDLKITAGGLVNLILKECVKVTGHEISGSKFIPDGITVDGVQVRVNTRIAPGQTLRIRLPEDPETAGRMIPVHKPITILYEDEDLVIINKPAGVAVHPSPGHYMDTMANFLAGYYEDKGLKTTCRIIGRLDKDTSGALVFAKNRASAARLTKQRAADVLKRTYIAITEGVPEPEEGTIEGNMDKIPGVILKRQMTGDESGLTAVTHYRTLAVSDHRKYAVVEFHIDTGRTHQIRLHMSSIGHPLVGDPVYGSQALPPKRWEDAPQSVEEREQAAVNTSRAMLHALRLSLVQPFTGAKIVVDAPVPKDFYHYLDRNLIDNMTI